MGRGTALLNVLLVATAEAAFLALWVGVTLALNAAVEPRLEHLGRGETVVYRTAQGLFSISLLARIVSFTVADLRTSRTRSPRRGLP